MEKNKHLKGKLVILVIILGALIVKLILLREQYFLYRYQEAVEFKEKSVTIEEKYGYGEILDVLRKSKDLQLKSINMNDDEKCNIEVSYSGDIRLLYDSLNSLNESKNFLGVNSININKDTKITSINMDFKKNR